MKKVFIYDSTLRDGAQSEGISFTVEDKLKIVKHLDNIGIDYIEAGNPGSNPKDLEFFNRVNKLNLKNIKLAAFGSTRRVNVSVEQDANVKAILTANTPVATIFGKSWDFHVIDILKTSLQQNLDMIRDTVYYLKSKGKEVFFDAEHFFDGYKNNPEYALDTLKAAADAGADGLVLCDTNGGTFSHEIYQITKKVVSLFSLPIGIHCHNDTGMAVANSIAAVQAGAVHVQGTINGYGERCGNANLCTIIPNLQLKMNIMCVPQNKIRKITKLSRHISEIANMAHDEKAPYVGHSAFAHKGGMHIDAILKNTSSFEHISPELVGNKRRILMSEVSGRSTILNKIREIDPTITKDSPQAKQIINELKELEHKGYQFEGAECSFELMVRKMLGKYKKAFDVKHIKVLIGEPWQDEYTAYALIKVRVDGKEEVTAAEGDGPVNAIDKALRKALEVFYPQLKNMHLRDYKVRVLNSEHATAAKVRVFIESTDGQDVWGTVGVSTDIIEASWKALVDSIDYMLLKIKGQIGGEYDGNDYDAKDFS